MVPLMGFVVVVVGVGIERSIVVVGRALVPVGPAVLVAVWSPPNSVLAAVPAVAAAPLFTAFKKLFNSKSPD